MNLGRPITSEYKWRDHENPLQVARYRALVVAATAAGYEEDRFAALAPVCRPTLLETESRKADWVQFYIEMLALGIDLDTVPDVLTCDYVLIANIAPTMSGAYATLTTALTGSNNDLKFTAKEVGNDGNLINITYVVAGNSTPLTIGVVGNAITVNVATGGGGAATSTASLIRTAINASAPAMLLLQPVTLAGADTGAGIVTAMATTYLSGGVNP